MAMHAITLQINIRIIVIKMNDFQYNIIILCIITDIKL